MTLPWTSSRSAVRLPGSSAAGGAAHGAASAGTPAPLAEPAAAGEWRYKGRAVTLRSAIFLTLDDPGFTRFAKAYSILMMLLIVLVTVCFVLESEAQTPTGLLAQTSALAVFEQIEIVSVSLFTAEYALRFATFPIKQSWWRSCTAFVLTPFNVIDALACFPFWVTFIIKNIDRERAPASNTTPCPNVP
jgi:hypothetical protein